MRVSRRSDCDPARAGLDHYQTMGPWREALGWTGAPGRREGRSALSTAVTRSTHRRFGGTDRAPTSRPETCFIGAAAPWPAIPQKTDHGESVAPTPGRS